MYMMQIKITSNKKRTKFLVLIYRIYYLKNKICLTKIISAIVWLKYMNQRLQELHESIIISFWVTVNQ